MQKKKKKKEGKTSKARWEGFNRLCSFMLICDQLSFHNNPGSVHVAVLQPNQEEKCSVPHNDKYCYSGNGIAGLCRGQISQPPHLWHTGTLSFTTEICLCESRTRQLCPAYYISQQIVVPDSKGVRSYSCQDTQYAHSFKL